MCESATSYIMRMTPYSGSWDEYGKMEGSSSEKVVLHLVKGLEGSGHIVVVDNFYSSVYLFETLYRNGIGALGTLRRNRKFIPESLRLKAAKSAFPKEPFSDPNFFVKEFSSDSETGFIGCFAWQAKKPVAFLTTVGTSKLISKDVRHKDPNLRSIKLPEVIDMYNYGMGGVDRSDQMKKSYEYPHHSKKWYIHYYDHQFEAAIHNANITYNQQRPDEAPTSNLEYRIMIMEAMLRVANMMEKPSISRVSSRQFDPDEDQTTEKTKPAVNESKSICYVRMLPENGRADCTVCKKKKVRRRVRYFCKNCKVSLCATPCFEIFHENSRM